MKRINKMALLTRILQGSIDQTTAKRLHEPELKPLIIVYEPHSRPPQPTDEVIVRGWPEDVTMPYSELDEYARRVGGIIVAMLPNNNR